MSYRGPAITYKIRKTTTNNKTGDNFSITIPRIVAQQFEGTFFKMVVSGNTITFESGCKMTVTDILIDENKKISIGGGVISFR